MAAASVAPSMKVSGEGPRMQGTPPALQDYLTDPSPSITDRLVARAAGGQDEGEAANEGLQELEAMMRETTRDVGTP